MSESTTLQAIGLDTSPNELTAPPGALRKAQNCVMLAPGLVGARRGFTPMAYPVQARPGAFGLFVNGGDQAETLVVNADDTFFYDSGTAWENIAIGGIPPNIDGRSVRVKYAQASQNLYCNPEQGIMRIDTLTKWVPGLAGGPLTQQIKTAATNATANGFLPTGYSVAYRLVFGFIDAHGTIILGRPSGRFVVANTSGGARNVDLTFLTAYANSSLAPRASFWQIYRTYTAQSYQTNDGGVSVSVPPDDEMYLCQEAFITDADVASGVSITDTTPDDFLGTPLYTNATRGDGTIQRNDPPPLAKVFCSFDSRMFYANTQHRQRVQVQILGAGEGQDGYTGIRIGDTLGFYNGTAALSAYTFRAADAYSEVNRTFKLETGLADPYANIQATAQSLVNLINATGGGSENDSWLAEDLSTPDGPGVAGTPGIIGIEGLANSSRKFHLFLNTYRFPIAIGGMVRAANVTTVTCAEKHGLTSGDTVRVDPTGTLDANFPAGTFTVTGTGGGGTTFTFAQVLGNAVSAQAYTSRRITPEPQYAWNKPPPPSVFSVSELGGMGRVSNVVTVNTNVDHGLSAGQVIALEPVTTLDPDFPPGTFTILSVPTDSSFTYAQAGVDVTSNYAYQSGQRVSSDPSQRPNGFSWSKTQQPEAVPVSNSGYVGTPDKEILALIASDTYLFAFAEDGVYTITATGNPASPYRVDSLDLTVHVIAPDTVQKVRGRIYALTNQGVVETTTAGCRIVSGPIEQDLFQYFGPTLPTLFEDAFAISYETEQIYILGLPALEGASEAPYNVRRCYVYSVRANAWTTWELPLVNGIVRSYDDTLFVGDTNAGHYISAQNNTRTAADYVDGSTDLTVDSWDAETKILEVADTTGVTTGDAVVQSDSYAIVAGVIDGTHLLLTGGAFTAGDAAAYAAIPIDLEWRTVTGSSPADQKTYREIHLHSRLRDFRMATLAFASDLVTSEVTLDVYPAKGTDGVVPDYEPDTEIYPGMPVRPLQLRVELPQDIARAAYLDVAFRIREAYALWWLNGFSLVDAQVGPSAVR